MRRGTAPTWSRFVLGTVLLTLVFGLLPGCRQGPERLVIGFVGSTVPEATDEQQRFLTTTLGEILGTRVSLFMFDSSADLVRALGTGQIDIGVLNPFAYVAAHDAGGAHAILRSVRNGTDHYRSEIIALADGGPKSVEELQGKTFGFVDPASPSGYLFPAAYLLASGIDPRRDFARVEYLGSATEVVRAVLDGQVAAGACREGTRELLYAETRDVFERVTVIAYTTPVPNDAIAVRAGFSADIVARIKQGLLDATATDEGRRAWKALTGAEALSEADDRDYDVVREMAAALSLDITVMVGAGD